MAAVPTTGTAAQAVPLQAAGMQNMIIRPAQTGIVQPQQVRPLPPRMIINSQVLQNVRPSQVLPGTPGHLLLKAENGQMHLVRLNPTPGQAVQPGTVTTATLPASSSHVTLNHVPSTNNAAIVATTPFRFQSQVAVVSSSGAITNATLATTVAGSAITNVVNGNNNTFTTLNNTSTPIINNSSSVSTTASNASGALITNNMTAVTSNNVAAGIVPLVATSATASAGHTIANASTQVLQTVSPQQPTASQGVSAESAKNKCKNFLATLLKLANEQNQPVARNVRSLIQGLIDNRVEPEPFTEQLQRLLSSSPQPCLVPFLKRTLPHLRLSLAKGEITIDGVNPPPLSSVSSSLPATTVIPALLDDSVSNGAPSTCFSPPSCNSITFSTSTSNKAAVITSSSNVYTTLSCSKVTVTNSTVAVNNSTPTVRSIHMVYGPSRNSVIQLERKQNGVVVKEPAVIRAVSSGLLRNHPLNCKATSVITFSPLIQSPVLRPALQQQIRPPAKAPASVVTGGPTLLRIPVPADQAPVNGSGVANGSAVLQPLQPLVPGAVAGTSTAPLVVNGNKVTPKVSFSKDRGVKEKQTDSYIVADDDINDVAAMGGVNLGEESQRILESTGFVGTQIRSCKDETFLMVPPLLQRLKLTCAKYDLEEPSKEFAALLSHAVQERLKTIIEKLSVIAEHRLDIVKNESRYEMTQDVRGQLRFLEDLDRLEKKRKDEVEREMLLRAARSRNKNEDPEQAKLKAKAKEMQRVEMEEIRQRDADLAAFKALQGARKKAKLDLASSEDGTFGGTFTQKQLPVRQRTKRVNIRDLIFLMEQDKDLNKSTLLYRNYLK